MFNENHISVTSANDINEMCKPLFEHSNITLFKYKRIFPDGSYIILSSNAAFVKRFTTTEWTLQDLEISKNFIRPGKRYYLFNMHNLLDVYKHMPPGMLQINKEFNTDFGFLIIEDHGLFYDTFYFSTQSSDTSIFDFCFNDLGFMEKFIFYFKDKAATIIKQATIAHKFYFIKPEDYKVEYIINMSDIKIISKNLNVSKYIFNLSGRLIKLSNQEMNSVTLLAKGRTIKEIAHYLDIAPRTVNYYLECAREKLKIQSNSQLVSIYWENLSLS